MEELKDKILYADKILELKEYKTYFKNEIRILNSFIINNHRLFKHDSNGKLYVTKKNLERVLIPKKEVHNQHKYKVKSELF